MDSTQVMHEAASPIKMISAAIIAWLGLTVNIDAMQAFIVLLIIDCFVGLLKSWLIENNRISGNVFFVGFLKRIIVLVIPIIIAQIAKGLGQDWHKLISMTLFMMVIWMGVHAFTNASKFVPSRSIMGVFMTKVIAFLNSLPERTKIK